jgi:hypothetical protein
VTELNTLWLTETIRLREEHAGPLEDLEANRLARSAGGDLPTRIQRRALWLAERDGLSDALKHWLQGARLALLVLAVLAVISGAGLAFAALGDGQMPVNVFWALGSLLGLNLILLLSWALGLVFAGEHGASLGRLWLWLSEKLARDAKAAQLAPALILMLQRHKLNRWAIGVLVNSLWLLAMLSALVILLTLLATRRYGFVWETTILGADTFINRDPGPRRAAVLLGFSVPTVEMIRASGDAALNIESARQAWAAWLVGVLLVYGVVPRLLLAGFCLWRWKTGQASLHLDLNLPGYAQLRERLMPTSERLGISDAAPEHLHRVESGVSEQQSDGALLVAIELDDQRPWPPHCRKREQRRHPRQPRIAQQTARTTQPFPPARLAIACDPRRSPDRGSLALIAELARSASATASGCCKHRPVRRWTPSALATGTSRCNSWSCPSPIAHR